MRIIGACTLALISVHLLAAPVRAEQLKMECQAAIYTGEPLGAYGFVFDTASGSLSVRLQPRTDVHMMFGWDVKNWKLLFAKGGHAVFYDIDAEDTAGPVKILSLNFENPNMFSYWMGTDFGENAPQYKAKCRRLN